MKKSPQNESFLRRTVIDALASMFDMFGCEVYRMAHAERVLQQRSQSAFGRFWSRRGSGDPLFLIYELAIRTSASGTVLPQQIRPLGNEMEEWGEMEEWKVGRIEDQA